MRGSSEGSRSLPPPPSPFIAFKPRQVMLLEQQRNPAVSIPMAKNEAGKPVELKSEDEYTVTCSVALWLESKGFSKVLKRFLSAAQIEDDNWKVKALNLNEVFKKYLDTCNNVHQHLGVKKQEEQSVSAVDINGNCMASEEIEGKKKRKKKTRGHDTTEITEDIIKSTEKPQEEKSGKASDGLGQDGEKRKASKGSDDSKDLELTVSAKKQKDKKKKKDKSTSEPLDSDEKKNDEVPEVVESKHKDSLVEEAENGLDESKKASKKRKRKDAEDKENPSGQVVGVEESKPKKTKGLEEGKDGQAAGENKEENVQGGQEGSHNAYGKQTDESTNVALDNNGLDKSESKSARKQHKKSSEPKSVNAFQRVKIDEVKFVDERLQDNSYWAKDGAETGYGAKAQEVLGQVKGRDFRHEKTKKKRGSYRGGQIDQQSHSIKFNYSDEE